MSPACPDCDMRQLAHRKPAKMPYRGAGEENAHVLSWIFSILIAAVASHSSRFGSHGIFCDTPAAMATYSARGGPHSPPPRTSTPLLATKLKTKHFREMKNELTRGDAGI